MTSSGFIETAKTVRRGDRWIVLAVGVFTAVAIRSWPSTYIALKNAGVPWRCTCILRAGTHYT
jgi:hypothetical protein